MRSGCRRNPATRPWIGSDVLVVVTSSRSFEAARLPSCVAATMAFRFSMTAFPSWKKRMLKVQFGGNSRIALFNSFLREANLLIIEPEASHMKMICLAFSGSAKVELFHGRVAGAVVG